MYQGACLSMCMGVCVCVCVCVCACLWICALESVFSGNVERRSVVSIVWVSAAYSAAGKNIWKRNRSHTDRQKQTDKHSNREGGRGEREREGGGEREREGERRRERGERRRSCDSAT